MCERPICTKCGLELVFIAIVLEGIGEMFKTWQCDCEYRDEDTAPKEIITGIVRAREGDDFSISYNWGEVKDE